MRHRLAALSLAMLAACGSGGKAGNNQAASEPASANAAAPASGPVELNAAWLAGRWQSEGMGDCGAADTYLTFQPDGSYSFMEEAGRWSLAGDQLTIEITNAATDGEAKVGDKSTRQMRAVGPDEAEFTVAGQPPSRIYRCRN